MQKKIIKNIEEMKNFADFYIKKLKKQDKNAEIILLKGDLGSGKTTFTQEIAKIFEIEDYVTSPTFVIQKQYKIKNNKDLGPACRQAGFKNLIHIDTYRLESGKELLDLNWEENISNPDNIIFIEWPEKVYEILPANAKTLKFKFINENEREISF